MKRNRECGVWCDNDTGFFAAEWAQEVPPEPPATWAAAHAKYGGGRELNYAELKDLMDLIFRLQEQSESIVAAMLPQVPSQILPTYSAWVEMYSQLSRGESVPHNESKSIG
jgi:hypothetical protein